MLPNNQESKKKKGIKEFFSIFISKKKEKHAPRTNVDDNLSEIEETSFFETQESLTDQMLDKKNVGGKTIILIGSTGSGKSALANVISGTSKFRENESSISVTKEVQEGEFTESGINYLAIDTVGIGDTKLKREEVLDKLAEAVYLARKGINQVFFVVSGRFDKHEIANYNLLKSIIFDETVASHTTVIRTNFPDFEKIDECEEDKKSLLAQNEELREIIKKCNGIIHVDNPSLEVKAPKNESDERKKFRENKIKERKITRSKSRDILLKHLKQVCQNQEFSYQPPKLKELSSEIFDYMEQKIRKVKEFEEIKIIENSEENLENIPLEYVDAEETKTELIVSAIIEKEWQQINSIQVLESDKNNRKKVFEKLKQIITTLGYQIERLKNIKKLKEETQKIDEFIRKKVLDHIFNNLDDITQIIGGDIFLNSIIGNNNGSLERELSLVELKEQKKEIEKKLLEQGGNNQSLEKTEERINRGRKILVELKKQLLNYKELIEEWQKKEFTKGQAEEWIKTEATPYDYEFVVWLRDIKRVNAEWALNNNEEFKDLRDKHNNCGVCQKCQQINTSYNWCQPCMEKELQEDIRQLSGQELVEKFIQQQGKNYRGDDKLSWIPFEEFTNIEYLAAGGFSKVYKSKWRRVGYKYDQTVVLKSLNNSQNITLDFLTEVANTKLRGDSIVDCYGISQDPITKEYIMVMQYIEGGDLRQQLQNKTRRSSLETKIDNLKNIAKGLKSIHEQGLVHRDLHSGNILNSSSNFSSGFITDLGLSRPASYLPERGKIFGVLPYVAPEILQGHPYTQAADVYSFGIVAYELFANAYPYLKMDDAELALKVCQGLRPDIDKVPIPQLLKDLIKKCWDADPWNRPTTSELYVVIDEWSSEVKIKNKANNQFCRQYKEIEEEYNLFSQNTPYKIPFKAITTSRLINTKQIAQLFQESEEKALELEIKKIEKEIDQPLTAELKELISDFIQTKKLTIKIKDEAAEDKTWGLEDQLKGQGLSEENIEKIMKYCERLIKAEQQLETNIEIPAKSI